MSAIQEASSLKTAESPQLFPLTPAIGAEVSGIDLSRQISDDEVRFIREGLNEHLVLFFRDQDITVDQHYAFASRFGAPHVKASTHKFAGLPGVLNIHIDANTQVIPGYDWHADSSNEPEPPIGSVLRLHTVPPTGGDTLFASAYAAYDALSDRLKNYLQGLTAVHDGKLSFLDMQIRNGTYDPSKVFHETSHPVIAVHPLTGRKLIYVNPTYTTRINELPPAESRNVLDFLFRHLADPRFQVRFSWRANSVAFWDNISAQHLAIWDYYPQTRSGYRVSITGPNLVAA